MIKIAIVDDHPVVRRGLAEIINRETDMEVTWEAGNARDAINLIRKRGCDIVVLDISLPGMSGIDLLKQLKREQKKLPVLILSVHPEEQYAMRLLKAGASGYLTKERTPEELVRAIRKVASGGKYVTESLAERIIAHLNTLEKPHHEKLSDREVDVMLMIASGMTTKEIAEKLCISTKTVSTYRSRILEKMGMNTNADIINYALKNKLID